MPTTIIWYGHSAFAIAAANHHFLFDPFLTHNPLCPVKAHEVAADYIFLSHAHSDHVGDTEITAGDTLAIAQRTGAKLICNADMAGWFARHGVQQIVSGNTGGAYHADFFSVQWTRAYHSSSFGDGAYGGNPNGFVLTIAGQKLYYAGDTDVFSDMALIGEMGIDLAFLPIGDLYTMGVESSIRAIQLIKPRYVIPMHYNTFPPIVQDVVAWAGLVNRQTNAQPVVLDPGQSYTIS